MSRPPDDERPMPWEQPGADAPDDPTVPWTAPDASPPVAPGVGWATPSTTPAGPAPGWGAAPPEAGSTPPPASVEGEGPAEEAPHATGPLLSSSPSAAIPPTVMWAAPQGPAPEVAPGLTYAGTAPRAVGYLVDLVLVGIVAGIIGGATGLLETVRVGDTTTMVGSIGYDLLSVALGAAYFIGSWSGGRRATLGQRLFSIQVGNAVDGRALTTEQAARRWAGLGLWIGALGFTTVLAGFTTLAAIGWMVILLITTATSPTKQGIHDRIAGSATARPTGAGNGLVTTCLVIVIGFVLLSLLAVVALIFLGDQISGILRDVGESV